MKSADVVVIGGGPAGLAAAISAADSGAEDIVILERDIELGGILNQCIHHGFGLQWFGEELTGPEYAHRFIEIMRSKNIAYKLDTMVLSVSGRIVRAVNSTDGEFEIAAGSVVLAMGCRERTRGALMIPGDRPSGIFCAGSAQRYVNLEGQLIGKRVIILGSGDIGLIMARRLTLCGAKVVACVEIMPYSGGLERNIAQCLDDFGIPLLLSHTITQIIGAKRVEKVILSKVDGMTPIAGTETEYEVDAVLISAGLIPENELSREAGVKTDAFGRIVLSQNMETSVPGIFACGNVAHVHDLVDNVSKEAYIAGASAARFAQTGKSEKSEPFDWESSAPQKPKSRSGGERVIICTVCPRGCHITVGDDGLLSGYSCPRGKEYAANELKCPMRTVTATVAIKGARYPRVSVRTNGQIPKELMEQAVSQLKGVVLKAPVNVGDVVLSNVLGTGVDFIITKQL